MNRRVATCVAVALALIAATATAQELKIGETKQLTFQLAGFNTDVEGATNGSEWGVVYTRGEDLLYNLYFLRATYDGDFIESHQVQKGNDGEQGLRNPKITAYPGGWAVTYTSRPTNTEYTDSMYFLLLDDKGRKVIQPTFIYKNSDAYVIPAEPVWTGSMFIVFYVAKTDLDYLGIWAAFIDNKGKRVMQDRLVTPLEELTYQFSAWTQVVPTADGIAMVASSGESDDNYRRVLLMISPEGQLLDDPALIGGPDANNVSFTSTLWNGKGFALTYYDIFDSGTTGDPQVRLFSPKGAWQSKKYVFTSNGVDRIYGSSFNGSNYVVFGYNKGNATVYCQQLDGKMNPVGGPLMVDDSTSTTFTNNVRSIGSDAFYFSESKKVGYSSSAWNLYVTRVSSPHSGKPEINFYNSAVHEIDGKYYAFLDWHVAGTENVLIKTKGGKWTLPASGFHATEIKKGKKARFKLIAANKAGKAKKKVKLVP